MLHMDLVAICDEAREPASQLRARVLFMDTIGYPATNSFVFSSWALLISID